MEVHHHDNSKTTIPSGTTTIKHPNGASKSKTIYITTKAGQAEDLQQRLASGKAITILKKVQNKTFSFHKIQSVMPSDLSIKQTTLNSPHKTVVSQNKIVVTNAETRQSKNIREGKNVVKPKAVALKVASSGIVSPANSQLLDLITNNKFQQQQHQHQRLHKQHHHQQLQGQQLDEQHRQQLQTQQQQQQLHRQHEQQQLQRQHLQQKQQPPQQLHRQHQQKLQEQLQLKQSEQHTQQQTKQVQKQVQTYYEPETKNQTTVLQKTATMIPISPGLRMNDRKGTQMSSLQPRLQRMPQIASTNCTSCWNSSILPSSTDCRTEEHNNTATTNDPTTQTVKAIVCPPYSSIPVSSNNTLVRTATTTQRQPTTRFKFPMSSLFSLNLKNTLPITQQSPQNRQLVAVSPKVESLEPSSEVKVRQPVQRKPSPRSPVTKKDKKMERWPEQDAPLSALSLQIGLQRALSMTPFSPFLDEDDSKKKDKKSEEASLCREFVSDTEIERADIMRSQQIIDEQLAKISKDAEKVDILPHGESDTPKQNFKTSQDLRSLQKPKEPVLMPLRKESKKTVDGSGKMKPKRKKIIHSVVEEDLKDPYDPHDFDKVGETPSCKGDFAGQDSGESVEATEILESNEILDECHPFKTKVLRDILTRILPQESISPTVGKRNQQSYSLGYDKLGKTKQGQNGDFASNKVSSETRLSKKKASKAREMDFTPISSNNTPKNKRLER